MSLLPGTVGSLLSQQVGFKCSLGCDGGLSLRKNPGLRARSAASRGPRPPRCEKQPTSPEPVAFPLEQSRVRGSALCVSVYEWEHSVRVEVQACSVE